MSILERTGHKDKIHINLTCQPARLPAGNPDIDFLILTNKHRLVFCSSTTPMIKRENTPAGLVVH